MARTIVYDARDVQNHYAALVQTEPAANRRVPGPAGRRVRKRAEAQAVSGQLAPQTPAPQNKDDYLSKIAKYVPAEVIAVVTLGFGLWDPTGNWIWFWLGVAAGANAIYLLSLAAALPPATPRPRGFFYMLSGLAFFAWAVATVGDARQAAHLTGSLGDQRAGFVLAAAAFLIPALDTILSHADFHLLTAAGT